MSALPPALVDGAPEAPPALDPERFRWRPEVDAQQPVRPSRRRALEALPEGGAVLDVGVGAGASSFGLAGKAGLTTGVDRQQEMLRLFEDTARQLGVAVRAVLGSWPDVAAAVEPADVAICHHALYFAAEIERFIEALTEHARGRVVIELSAFPPLTRLNPLWEAFHGMRRPEWRVADSLEEVVSAMGVAVQREDMVLPARELEVTPEFVGFVRRRLCVGPERDPEIAEFLQRLEPRPETVAALWWPGSAS